MKHHGVPPPGPQEGEGSDPLHKKIMMVGEPPPHLMATRKTGYWTPKKEKYPPVPVFPGQSILMKSRI
jgi:hypothetical protein